MPDGQGYMIDPKGALEKLEVVVRQQTVKKDASLVFHFVPERTTQGAAFYRGALQGIAAELVREAVIPGQVQRQRIQYTSANAYCRLEGAFELNNFKENLDNLALEVFNIRSRLLLTSGGITGPVDPAGRIGANQTNLLFLPAGTARRKTWELDVRGALAAGGKVGDEAIAEIEFALFAKIRDPDQPIPARLTLPNFKATLVTTLTSPTHL